MRGGEAGCPSKPWRSRAGGHLLHYVYLLESLADTRKRYVGVTSDLKKRIVAHNNGHSPHTSKHTPWKLITYLAFSDEEQALAFEKYLKSGSGHAFARKRLWPTGRFRDKPSG